MAISVPCKPCSKGNPMPRSVARHAEAMTSAARTGSLPGDPFSVTQRRVRQPRSPMKCSLAVPAEPGNRVGDIDRWFGSGFEGPAPAVFPKTSERFVL